VAIDLAATVSETGGRTAAVQDSSSSRAAARTGRAIRAVLVLACTSTLLSLPAASSGASNKVRLTGLTDVNFGTISNLGSDSVQSESVCLYADTDTNGYDVTAIGTGPGGAFQLASGLSAMPYEVQWSSTAGQSSGAQLAPSLPLTSQTSAASHQTCANGPAASASLVLILRSAALSSATAGSYSGTLTLLVGPE
jgi:hypothetical protein